MSTTGLFSKSQTLEMRDEAVTSLLIEKVYNVTPREIIILILFQITLGKEGWVVFGRG